MKKLFLPVEWKLSHDGRYYRLKSGGRYIGLVSITVHEGKFFNSCGKTLKDDNEIPLGYNTLKEAQTAVEEYYGIKCFDMRINNEEVPPHA
ncbi:MAG: hypothetical protein KAV87_52005 [Desulfobacteraceae bacterium]|nr:hypothetical protein [Desulfobacteraceae bacterium]